ncbi:thioredoxin [Acetobacteroides hydrogenigenes]|uniref:Thioredoxin n=1 Tax=Acetobacteroides hydrogenigenes TaxID=979970 RepID=A0A4R2EHS1_9BACT|nr:thioredoxin [Acetobacteroides hydrogenigenes]TCN67617.1 thioredoxin 1 [Acetobacteroides hydrogenigenes]
MRTNFETIIGSERPVLVDFYAEWCGPCKMQAPVLKDIAAEVGDMVRIIKVDVDKNPKVAAEYQVKGVPTLILFKNGKVQWRQSGMLPKQQLLSVINQYK